MSGQENVCRSLLASGYWLIVLQVVPNGGNTDPPIPTFGRFCLEIFLNMLFLFLFCYAPLPIHLQLMHHPCTCMHRDEWRLTVLVHSAPSIRKHWSYVVVTLNTKCEMHPPREFPGYWWLFRMQHLSPYSARLHGWRKKKMNNSDFRPFQVCHFKTVNTHCYYYYRLGQAL